MTAAELDIPGLDRVGRNLATFNPLLHRPKPSVAGRGWGLPQRNFPQRPIGSGRGPWTQATGWGGGVATTAEDKKPGRAGPGGVRSVRAVAPTP